MTLRVRASRYIFTRCGPDSMKLFEAYVHKGDVFCSWLEMIQADHTNIKAQQEYHPKTGLAP